MVSFTLLFTKNEMISISTSQTFRSWVVIFYLRRPMAFISLNLFDTPGLARRMNVLFWGQATFQEGTQTGIPGGTLEIVIQEVVWSIRGSYSAIWSIPLTNVKWHPDPWPTVTTQPIRLSINFMTLIPNLTFTELWVVSMEHSQREWHASRDCLPFRTPGSVPYFGTYLRSNCWDKIPRTCHVLTRLFCWIPLGTFSILNLLVNIANIARSSVNLCIIYFHGDEYTSLRVKNPTFLFVDS